MKKIVVLLTLFIFALQITAQTTSDAAKKYEEAQTLLASKYLPTQYDNKIVPDWEFKLYRSKDSTFLLKNYKGKKILLALTNTDCGYCKLSIPMLKQLKSESDTSNFVVLAVFDRVAHTPLAKHIKKYGINYDCLRFEGNFHKEIVIATPVFMIISEESMVLKTIMGYEKEGVTEKIIRSYLYQ